MTSDTRRLQDENKLNFERIRQQVAEQQVAFVLTEIDTGINFCKVALSTRDPERRTRNIDNAVKGLQTALHFARGLAHDLSNDHRFQEKLAHLKDLLRELGQEV